MGFQLYIYFISLFILYEYLSDAFLIILVLKSEFAVSFLHGKWKQNLLACALLSLPL